MIGRSVQGLPKLADRAWIAVGEQVTARPGRRRRTLAAFLSGAGLLALGLSSLQAGVAAGLVSKSSSPIAFILSRANDRDATTEGSHSTPDIVWTALDPNPPNPGRKRNAGIIKVDAIQAPASLPRRSVCVRLCDGYFFPIGPLSRAGDLPNHEAACSGLCPDAPTQLFIEPAGSDKIGDAISSNGARYASLPAAFRNRTVADRTCSCHRGVGPAFSLRDDFTLRKGDSVMTSTGFMVFRGARHQPLARNDFTTLANASMSREKRTILASIERASLPGLHQPGEPFLPPRTARIAFAAPPPARSTSASLNNSIRFVESKIAASN
jgi:hypothetical protein